MLVWMESNMCCSISIDIWGWLLENKQKRRFGLNHAAQQVNNMPILTVPLSPKSSPGYQTRPYCSCIGDRILKNGNCRFSLAVGFISDCPFIIFFFKNSVHHLIVLLSVKWLPLSTMLHLYHHHLRHFLFFAIPSSPPA
jgi:hypothetical protein